MWIHKSKLAFLDKNQSQSCTAIWFFVAMELPQEDIANPFVIGSVILDGDEDSQVVVFENGQPTAWALQFRKWRIYFQVPEPPTSDSDGDEPRPEQPLDETNHLIQPHGKKRTSEEAGLELN